MNILLLNQFFWPDAAATSQLLTDLARELADRGHRVSVICGAGSYAEDAAHDGPPVTMHRVRTTTFVRGRVGRVLSYLSFFSSAGVRSLRVPRPDLVVTLTTPPLLPLLGTLLKRLRGARHFIWEMDMYPDVAVDLGYFRRGGLADHVVGALADLARREADGIIALGECMKDRLRARGIAPEKISVADNWADGREIQPVARAGKAGELVVLYSGNLGLAHDVATISGAMQLLRQEPIRFVFAGGGARTEELRSLCTRAAVEQVAFRPYAQRSSLGESLGAGDIGLVTQLDSCCGSVVPSKVYGLLAAGRPVLFVGPAAATPARIIRRFGCGWHVRCGDVPALAALLRDLARRPEQVRAAGLRARAALVQHYDRPLGVARVCSILGAGAPAATCDAEVTLRRQPPVPCAAEQPALESL